MHSAGTEDAQVGTPGYGRAAARERPRPGHRSPPSPRLLPDSLSGVRRGAPLDGDLPGGG